MTVSLSTEDQSKNRHRAPGLLWLVGCGISVALGCGSAMTLDGRPVSSPDALKDAVPLVFVADGAGSQFLSGLIPALGSEHVTPILFVIDGRAGPGGYFNDASDHALNVWLSPGRHQLEVGLEGSARGYRDNKTVEFMFEARKAYQLSIQFEDGARGWQPLVSENRGAPGGQTVGAR